MYKKVSTRAMLVAGLSALGITSCATPAHTLIPDATVIPVDRQAVRAEIVVKTARNRFTEAFAQADKEFDRLYEDNDR